MKKLKVLWRVLRQTGASKIAMGFVVFLMMAAVVIWFVEPNVHTYGDALWFSFVSFTTIGYGDFLAVTLVGRITTVVLTLYGILVVALVPGVVVSFFNEVTKLKANETMQAFMDKLEHLPELSPDELAQISENVKKRRYHLD